MLALESGLLAYEGIHSCNTGLQTLAASSEWVAVLYHGSPCNLGCSPTDVSTENLSAENSPGMHLERQLILCILMLRL